MTVEDQRRFMKSRFPDLPSDPSDQQKGLPAPPLEKPHDENAQIIDLPKPDGGVLTQPDIFACLKSRRSRRQFTKESLSLEELSFLLWATQGIDEVILKGKASLRPSPSAGARHPFETYIAVHNIEGLDPAVYRYLPLKHRLVREFDGPDMSQTLGKACLGQNFVGNCAATFIWSCIPYRCEWRYPTGAKVIVQDSGHLCQNLYLACEAMGLGTCAIGAYDQSAMDNFLRLDGEEEFVIYLAPVGRV